VGEGQGPHLHEQDIYWKDDQGHRGTGAGSASQHGGGLGRVHPHDRVPGIPLSYRTGCTGRFFLSWGTWSTWSAVINLTSRAGELRSAPSGPDDRDRVTG